MPATASNSSSSSEPGESIPITPELIKKITDKVYALLLADARIERERRQPSPQNSCAPYAGTHTRRPL